MASGGRFKTRFQILQRDGFRCRYCGATADDARLEVDHVIPRSLGGPNNESNLITACFACNRGKRADLVTRIGVTNPLHSLIAVAILEVEIPGAVPTATQWSVLGCMVDDFGPALVGRMFALARGNAATDRDALVLVIRYGSRALTASVRQMAVAHGRRRKAGKPYVQVKGAGLRIVGMADHVSA